MAQQQRPLADPTRPPPGFLDPADARTGNAGPASAASPLPLTSEPAKLVLQSVMLPRQGKAVAVISGKYLPVGSRIEGWELKTVSERDVLLTQGKERRVLKLTPQVTKTMVTTSATEKKPPPVRKKKAKKAVAKESELTR